jgi:NADH-quinone oxidoreductase subunit N
MNGTDALALLPLLLLGGTAVVVMLAISVKRSHPVTAGLTLAGLAASFLSIFAVAPLVPRQVTSLLLVDGYALFYLGLIIASAAAVAVLSYSYFAKQDGKREELYLLLVLATLGCAVLVTSVHFASFLLGLEILSIALYGMVGYVTDHGPGLEAGIKYLILASASAAFLLFGMALIYAATGTMSFSSLRDLPPGGSSLALLLPGIALSITGIGFKLGVVPFHLWTPDVYQGAPAPVSAFVATTSKTAMVALLLRYLAPAIQHSPALFVVLSVIAVASMVAGNLLGLRQTNVKRILAYSSIAHFGYILVALLAGTSMMDGAVAFYLVAYTVTILIAFGVVGVLSTSEADAANLEDYSGLFWRRPVLASVFTVALLSLAGIPATMGFVGKFYVLASGAEASAWALNIVLVLASVIGLFYYLRIVVTLFSAVPEGQRLPMQRLAWGSAFCLGGLAVLLVWFGVYPAPLLGLIRATVGGLN